MATADTSRPSEGRPRDLVLALRRSGLVTEARLADVVARVESGEWPEDGDPLARRLVLERVLTEFQARRLLAGRSRGLTVGRYVLLSPVARGMMGRVFKAQHRMLGRVVALKLIVAKAPSPRAVAWFRREMRLIGRLDHPNIVRALDAGESEGRLYIAMEYLTGSTLKGLLEDRGPLPPREVAWYGAQATRGLAHAHARGIIHRDVKPANLFLTRGGQVKVLDLGIGALLTKNGYGPLDGDPGSLVGTIDYISPEQACRRPLDGRSDLYSLGCTMYHLITDKLPFPGRTSLERLAMRIGGEHDPIAADLPDQPPGLVRVMARLLAHRPEDRYQTADEAAEALFDLLRDEPGFLERIDHARRAPVRASLPPSAPAPRRSHRGALAAGAVLAATAACLWVAFASSPHGPPGPVPPGPTPARVALPTPAPAPSDPRPATASPRPGPGDRTPPDLRGLARRAAASWASLLARGPGRDARSTAARAPGPLGDPEARRGTTDRPVPAGVARAAPSRGEPVAIPYPPALPDPGFALAYLRAPTAPRTPATSPVPTAGEGRAGGRPEPEGRPRPSRPPEVAAPSPPHPALGPGPAPPDKPAGQPSPRTATIHVFMPAADSELVVRGDVGRGNPDEWYGPKRVVHTPPLGASKDYLVGAFWMDPTGRPTVRQKEMKVEPGRTYQVDLRVAEPTVTEHPR